MNVLCGITRVRHVRQATHKLPQGSIRDIGMRMILFAYRLSRGVKLTRIGLLAVIYRNRSHISYQHCLQT